MAHALSKKNLALCLNRLKELDTDKVLQDEEFLFFHKHRNYFNILYGKNEGSRPILSRLEQVDDKVFVDNFGRRWIEETLGIVYHRPFKNLSQKLNYGLDLFKDRSERFCRKFVSLDQGSIEAGYSEGCEFELIIRNGERVIGGPFMETYNYGRSATLSFAGSIQSTVLGLHGKFDVKPHKDKGYSYYDTTHYKKHTIKIIDVKK